VTKRDAYTALRAKIGNLLGIAQNVNYHVRLGVQGLGWRHLLLPTARACAYCSVALTRSAPPLAAQDTIHTYLGSDKNVLMQHHLHLPLSVLQDMVDNGFDWLNEAGAKRRTECISKGNVRLPKCTG
jgi:hypothetical protein